MKKVVVIASLAVFCLLFLTSQGCSKPAEEASTTSKRVEVAQLPSEYDYYEEEVVETVSKFRRFPVYKDRRSPDNHFIPSGWMGDVGDIRMDDAYMKDAHSGSTCIKFVYTAQGSNGQRWGGVYWQNPANNWGEKDGGFDLTGATKLTFWAKGEKGGENIQEFKMGGITGRYSDSDVAGIGPVALTKDWKKYEIDLTDKDLSYISGGFVWATNADVNPDGCTFYLDDIIYE
jgi:hypothetical protein